MTISLTDPFTTIATVGAGVTSYVDTGAITGANSYNNHYEVAAIFPGGVESAFLGSSVSESSAIPLNNVYVAAALIRNGTGRWQVMFSGLPANSPQTVLLTWTDGNGNSTWQSLSTASLTNGIYPIPDANVVNLLGDSLSVQLMGPNGEPGQITYAGVIPSDAPYFVDGRQHLKQNLTFLIRAAGVNTPFGGTYFFHYTDPGYALNQTATTFEQCSFLHREYDWYWLSDQTILSLDNVWPFTLNYYLANDLLNETRTNNPFGNTNFTFQINFGNSQPAPPILNPNPYYTLQPGLFGIWAGGDVGTPPAEWGLTFQSTQTVASLQSGLDNVFNLPYQAGVAVDAQYNETGVGFAQGVPIYYHSLAPGGELNVPESGYAVEAFASQTVTPTLQAINYYFAPVSNPDMDPTNLPGEIDPEWLSNFQPYPLPVYDDFNVTNQTPAIIIGTVGQSMILGGWAKYSIQNAGSPTGKYGYLGQYFVTNAFLLNSNAVVTTNGAGVMSPYGEFFPLQAGVAQVVTMPDIDPPYQQGTNVVRIISMNVDANHDGVMDLSYARPDQTSPSRPLRFWANDDQDAGDFGGTGVPGVLPLYSQDGNNYADDVHGNPVYYVHGRRDLVDYFPVYLNISSLFQSNALSAGISFTDTNWQFVLSQADGVLRFTSTTLTPTNYMNFLRDTNVSGVLATSMVTTVTSSGVTLPPSFVGGIATNNQGIILVEAAAPTTQPLVLTIYHGTNQIAQTQLYLSISGVEQMFRHKSLLINSDSREVPDRLTDASVPNEPDTLDENFVFVHGYNVNPNQARGWQADIFKRMYWSGSHAKFYGVTWEGYDSQGGIPGFSTTTPNYQTNVVRAFQTAPSLAAFISTLTNSGSVVVAGHSLGNMVTLSALSDWHAPISQYFMVDAAVPIEAIDGSTPINTNMVYSTSSAPWLNYTTALWASKWFTLWPSNDARSTLTWSNRLANFGSTTVYDFYSSGEEVLRTQVGAPPGNLLTLVGSQLMQWIQGQLGTYAWAWQEKLKGCMSGNSILSSDHGGWGLNENLSSGYVFFVNGLRTNIPPVVITNSVLQTNAFFDMSVDTAMFTTSPSGSTYAQNNGNRILSDAIPAVTLPIGANPVSKLAPFGQPSRNFDMQTLYENGWPIGRGPAGYPANTTALGEWHHSDLRVVAYTFTYQLFNQMVSVGNLK